MKDTNFTHHHPLIQLQRMQQKIKFVRQFKTKYSCFGKINIEKQKSMKT